jgi:hypothetical protein
VVDSCDIDRIGISRDEFHAILEEEELKDALILVYANKQDLPGALSEAQISESLGLHDVKSRPWAIFKTSAIKGEGLFEVSQSKRGPGPQGMMRDLSHELTQHHSHPLGARLAVKFTENSEVALDPSHSRLQSAVWDKS